MASKREKLERQATEMGLKFQANTSDEDLEQLIQDFKDDDSDDTKYYRSDLYALSVVVGDPDPTKGEVAPKTVDFVPYYVYERGKEGKQRVGFLKTSNGSAIRKLENDEHVQEITKQEYEDAITPVKDEAGQQISGYRAPY